MEYDDKYEIIYENQYGEHYDIKDDIKSPSINGQIIWLLIFLLICLSIISVNYFIVNYVCINVKKLYHKIVMNILIKEIDKDEIVDKINNMCSICLEEYIDDRKLNKLKCGHIYHKECIMKWIKNNNECPLCRKEVI